RSSRRAKTVQETHGMTSCAEWTGVLLSTLLKECGLKGGASWFVAEGVEEVKGASSMPIAKAMDDCIVAYGMNGEAVRPQNGFPLRLMVPGFEGIFHTKWLRRIKIVDRYYMNYNDYGHLHEDAKEKDAALSYQIGPKSVITFLSGGQQHSALEDRQGRERDQWERVGFSSLRSRSPCSSASPRWRRGLPMEWDARRPPRKFARWISPSARPAKNSRRERVRPRRARRSIARR